MRIRNLDDLDHRIRELTEVRNDHRSRFLGTSDRTRDVAGSMQKGLYFGQLALRIFRTLTNYHLPPRRRIQRVIITISSIIVINAIRALINRRLLAKGRN